MEIISNIIKAAIEVGSKLKRHETPVESQKETLKELLQKSKNTAFGKYYGFESLLNTKNFQQEFAKEIPYHDYDDMEFWWRKSYEGKPDICWPEKVDNFAVSSGTTGHSKHIPVTDEMLESIRNAGLQQVLSLSNFKDLPESFYTKQILMLGSSTNLDEKAGHLEGEISGISAANIPNWFHAFYKPGQEISSIDDWDSRVEAIAKEAKNWDIGSISGIPSWIELMLQRVMEYHKVDSIHDIWPNLAVYTSGGVALDPYKKSFEKLFSKPVQYIDTYLASEGYLATQVRPETDAMQLIYDNGVYFEFVPFDEDSILESGKINPEKKALNISQVEEGKEYILLISTVSGTWRYMIGDTIKFTDVGRSEIKITGRTKFFLNVVGSQLSVNKMDDAIESLNEEFPINIKEFTVAAVKENDEYIHHWYLGVEDLNKGFDHSEIKDHLDQKLKNNNKNYKVARDKALKDVKVDIVSVDQFIAWNDQNKKKGGQVKMAKVMKEEAFREWQEFIANQ
ncbi:GH3 family domain-containing protein [Marivirga arenosa]|uniref:GH3 auxin-responsive promoter family protein n=1 Tax=Marivirga arenosa TaxID=3059076 RepID=A0AA49GEW5_9BACT|nr:GH3 auxin-responsive promoter family protein [Marivirga sp. BKB1-2]WKK83110.2 GH3 auxin-responsive promoter family protein [Marivirga sp. BKB1-2]